MAHTDPSKIVSSFSSALAFLSSLRWKGRMTCPKCRSQKKFYVISDGRYKCSACNYRFRPATGTQLGRINLPVQQAFHLVHLFSMDVPVFKTRYHLPVSMKTAHRAYRLFREIILEAGANPRKITHPDIHPNFKRWASYKNMFILGINTDGEKVFTFPVNLARAKSILPFSKQERSVGDLSASDHWNYFSWLKIRNGYISIKKGEAGFEKKIAGESAADEFWSFLKYRLYEEKGVRRDLFPKFLKETEFRFNNQENDLFYEISKLVCSEIEKRV